jgi:hypothetical protein
MQLVNMVRVDQEKVTVPEFPVPSDAAWAKMGHGCTTNFRENKILK